jgi:hypothetical protein
MDFFVSVDDVSSLKNPNNMLSSRYPILHSQRLNWLYCIFLHTHITLIFLHHYLTYGVQKCVKMFHFQFSQALWAILFIFS